MSKLSSIEELFAGRHFDREVIILCVRWYLLYKLSFRDLNVFSRYQDGIRHHWASENVFKRGSTSPLDPVWPIFGVLDLIREGRGDTAAYPNLQY